MSQGYAQKALSGSFVMLLIRWLNRGLGLISLSIVARVLTPEDFGVYGSAALVLGIFLTMRDVGLADIVVRIENLDHSHIRTVWTLQLVVTGLISLAILIFSDAVADLIGDPRVAEVLKLTAFVPIIGALESPAAALLLRNFDYKRMFLLRFLQKILTVITGVTLAFMLKSYLALAYTALAGGLIAAVLSYMICPYLPKLTLEKLSEMRNFAFWSIWRGVAVHVARIVDEVIVRLNSATETYAFYRTSRDLSRSLIAELIAPAASPIFAALSRIKHDEKRFTAAITASLSTATLVATPVAIAMFFAADAVVTILLGAQWLNVIPVFQWVAVGVAAQTCAGLIVGIYSALGVPKFSAMWWFLRALLIGLACYWTIVETQSIEAVAMTYAVVSICVTFAEFGFVFFHLKHPYPIRKLYESPAIAAVLMAGAIHFEIGSVTEIGIINSVIEVVLGGLIYVGAIAVLWRWKGFPTGGESALWGRISPLLRKSGSS